MGSHRGYHLVGILLCFALIFGACAESPAPLATAESLSEPASNDRAGDPGAEPGSDMATAEAALDQSGKPGPTLPAGDVTLQPEPGAATPTPSSPGIESEDGQVEPAGISQVSDSEATLSPEQLATLDSSLDASGKPGEQPLDGAAPPATDCLRGTAMLLMPLAALVVYRRRKMPDI